MNKISYGFLLSILLLGGCMHADDHVKNVQTDKGDRLTLGKVQKEIRVGMSSAEVVEVLGSPNMVTTDEERREVWVYDKISTEVVRSQSEGYATLILIGTDRDSGAESKTQRTLTIVIKFDTNNKVRDFAYHSSAF